LAASGVAANGQAPASPAPATAAPAAQEPAQHPQPAAADTPQTEPQVVPQQLPAPAKATAPDAQIKPEKDPILREGDFSIHTVGGKIKEDQLKQMLVGKTLYLRGGYQDNNLEFDERGRILTHSSQGSYTLSQVQINKVKLSKKKVELFGDRYGLHFLGAAPYDDPTSATDRVKINPKKKALRISFDREEVEKPKDKDKAAKKKDKHHGKSGDSKNNIAAPTVAAPVASDTTAGQPDVSEHPPTNDRQSDKKRTTTKSAAKASQTLLTALNNAFSLGVDERMIAAMPDFWKLYYQAAQSKTDYKPTDPGVFRQSTVDQKAKLISAIDPPSNELAQANGVAGIALYHAVVGSDGKVEEVVAGRPIGFGLDESAEQTIRKAAFQPAMKDSKPVPVSLNLVVSFRIYSKRTSQPVPTVQAGIEKSKETILPGPYTAQAQAQARPQAQTAQPSAGPQ
jgi:outer membrane biosynthesis protein TonB